jgi:hypothetical protein
MDTQGITVTVIFWLNLKTKTKNNTIKTLSANNRTRQDGGEKPPFFFLLFNRYFFIDKPRTEIHHPSQRAHIRELNRAPVCVYISFYFLITFSFFFSRAND